MNLNIFEKFNIKFRLVDSEVDSEKLRNFRNQDHVKKEMFYKKEILPDHHRNWFRNLDCKSNFYFIYSIKNVDVGVVNLKNVDQLFRRGEYGVFVGNENFLGNPLNIIAVLFILDYAFTILNLDHLQAHILPTNIKAISMNTSLGFKLVDSHENLYLLDKRDYLKTKQHFERLFTRTQSKI